MSAERDLDDAGRAALGVTGRFEYGPLGDALRASGLSWRPLVAIGVLGAGIGAVLATPTFVDPMVRRALGSGFGAVALGRLVLGGLVALGMLRLHRRGWSRPRVATIGAVAGALALLAAAALPGGTGLFGLLAAIAVGCAAVAHVPLLVDHYRPEVRVRVLCAYTAGLALGVALAAALPALADGAGLTWRASTLALGALALVGAALLASVGEPGVGRWELDTVGVAVADRFGASGEVAVSDVDPADLASSEIDKLRRAAAARSARPLLLLVAMVGVLLGPAQELLGVLLRDRWELTAPARPLAAGLLFVLTLPGLAWVARRGELLFRAGPSRLAHLATWLAAVAAVAIGLGAVVPAQPVSFVLLAGAWTGILAILPIVATLLLALTTPSLRAHASVLVWLSVLAGILLGGAYSSAIGSRFGVVWAFEAVALLVLLVAARLTPTIAAVDADTDGAASRLVEAEVLAAKSSRGERQPLLTCRRIDFSYGQLQVLFDVDFTVDDGEMVALLGTNGAGKSTLLRVVSGLGIPSRGSVHFRGADITYLDTDKRVKLGISQIPGGKGVFGPMTVVDNLVAYGFTHERNRAAIDRGIEETFDAFPRLAERRNQLASTLSGGEQQMLALAKAFILRPRVLLIDELSLGLAPKVVGELLAMVERINRDGTAIVLVEQSVNIALSLVDHAYFMEKGAIRFDGPAKELIDRPDLLRSVFLAGVEQGLAEAGDTA